MTYQDFLQQKHICDLPTGMNTEGIHVHPSLFEYQRDIVLWALRRGRACIWAECGLGKTFMQLEWARCVHEYTRKPVLIFPVLAALSLMSPALKECKQ